MGFIATKAKYYKDSNASGELGHVNRVFNKNSNVLSEEMTLNNFGDILHEKQNGDQYSNLYEAYKSRLADADNQKKESGKRGITKNANTYIDMCVIFDRDIFDELIKSNRQEELKSAMADFMGEIKDKHGFDPIGFEFHLDEGHKNDETGEIKHNYHAHAIFLNHDFENNKSCLRNMRKKDWSNTQDLAHNHFKKFGFERGISKSLTNKKGLSKEDYLKELENKAKTYEEEIIQVLEENKELLDNSTEDLKKINLFENIKTLSIDTINKLKDQPITKKILPIIQRAAPKTYAFGEKRFKQFLGLIGAEAPEAPKNTVKNDSVALEESNTFESSNYEPKKEEKPEIKVFDSNQEQIEELREEIKQKKELNEQEKKKIKNRRKNSKRTKKN